jgi:hypothetical protein
MLHTLLLPINNQWLLATEVIRTLCGSGLDTAGNILGLLEHQPENSRWFSFEDEVAFALKARNLTTTNALLKSVMSGDRIKYHQKDSNL